MFTHISIKLPISGEVSQILNFLFNPVFYWNSEKRVNLKHPCFKQPRSECVYFLLYLETKQVEFICSSIWVAILQYFVILDTFSEINIHEHMCALLVYVIHARNSPRYHIIKNTFLELLVRMKLKYISHFCVCLV